MTAYKFHIKTCVSVSYSALVPRTGVFISYLLLTVKSGVPGSGFDFLIASRVAGLPSGP